MTDFNVMETARSLPGGLTGNLEVGCELLLGWELVGCWEIGWETVLLIGLLFGRRGSVYWVFLLVWRRWGFVGRLAEVVSSRLRRSVAWLLASFSGLVSRMDRKVLAKVSSAVVIFGGFSFGSFGWREGRVLVLFLCWRVEVEI